MQKNRVLTAEQLMAAAKRGKLKRLLELYLKSCQREGEADAKKSTAAFPNLAGFGRAMGIGLAGFCRFIGCGLAAMELLRDGNPEVYDYVCTVLEDEALRYSVSPTVMSAYLKQRLGLGEKPGDSGTKSTECGQLKLVFEHDILEDGE